MLTLERARRDSQAGISLVELLVAMIILGIVSTMLVAGWINLQRASATALRTNNARATARDAMSRISNELRGAQPTALPTATPTPTPQPPVTFAAPMEVRFNSSFNAATANADGSGLAALRPTRIWLDPTLQSAPWNPQCRTLFLQKDMTGTAGNGSFTDTEDRSIMLARNVANDNVADPDNGTSGTAYTPVFWYGYRATGGGPVLWTDNLSPNPTLPSLASVVAVRVRLIIDKKMGGTPGYVDLTTTVRLRNASSD